MVINKGNLKSFWNGKKVLITGHTGFKGSWLSSVLIYLGADVRGVSLGSPTEPSMSSVIKLNSHLTGLNIDIRDRDVFINSVKEFQPDVLFHLAAQALVRHSYAEPEETYSTNVLGTLNVLESIRHANIKASVLITTDKVYENNEWIWGYREEDRLGGKDPYSSSKACCELLIDSYRHSFLGNTRLVASARAGNVIGGGDWSQDRLIPDIINKISSNETVEIRSPQSVRPWQHVLEPLYGYLLLAQQLFHGKEKFASSFNFGPESTGNRTVEEICNELIQKMGKGEWAHKNPEKQLKEAGLLMLDISKAKSELEWTPKWGLSKTLEKIVDWNNAYENKEDMFEFTNRQINEFFSE